MTARGHGAPGTAVDGSASCAPADAAAHSAAVLSALRASQAHAQIDTVETHMSWVFLSGDRVLKLKKPVRYPFLDFSTLAAREACCREEVRLNSRLAPGVYRGLLALLRHGDRFTLVPEAAVSDRGDVVDWLVLMHRLPRVCMLDRAIADASVQPAQIDALVAVLADFYRSTAPVPNDPDDPDEMLVQFQREQAITREVLLRPQFQVDGAADALDRLDRALQQHRDALRRRAAEGRIVDGHGDLRPEHVCLLQVPVVIDCLEFNARLRQVDPFDELAFLAMECEMAGAAWIGPRLVDGCAAALGDAPPPAVLQLYVASRALLRARLSLAHLLDPQPRTPQRWLPQTQRYVARALQALDTLEALPA